MIKWLFSDIDGTILPYNQPFSNRTRSVLRQCPVPVSLVSGRMPLQMLPLIKQLGLTGIHCGNNGAVIFRVEQDGFVTLKTLPLKMTTVMRVIKMLRHNFPEIAYCWYELDQWFASRPGPEIDEEADYTGVKPTIRELPADDGEVLALLVIVSQRQRRDQVEKAIRQLQLPDLQLFDSGWGYLEMTSVQAGKSSIVNYVKEHFRLTRDELAAFGDGGNDLTMLKEAGYPVAVENAAKEIKRAARLIVPADINDGVAQQIESWQARGQLG